MPEVVPRMQVRRQGYYLVMYLFARATLNITSFFPAAGYLEGKESCKPSRSYQLHLM
ncbi:hypothetical protein BDW71DRAFT_180012 [Aspergillus fruticulosus]